MRAVGAEADGTEPASGVVLVQSLVVGPAVQAEDLIAMFLRPMLAIVQQYGPGAPCFGGGSQVVQVQGTGAFLARPVGVLVGQGDQSADRARGIAGYEEFSFGQFPFEVTAGKEIFVAFPLDDVAFGEPLLTLTEDLQDRFQVGGLGGGYGIVVVHGLENQRFWPSQPSRSRLRY